MSKATSITSVINQSDQPTIVKQLYGVEEINAEIIQDFDDYKYVFKARHDLIHAAICDKLNLSWGEKAVSTVLQNHPQVSRHQYFEEIKKQTPDYLGVIDNSILIVEVTVSTDLKARSRKASKYALLCKVLIDCGFKLEYKIFVINPRNVFLDRLTFIRDGLDDLVIDFFDVVCSRASLLFKEIHMTTRGQIFYQNYYEMQSEIPSMNFTSEEVLNTHENYGNKCFHSASDLSSILRDEPASSITPSDSSFLSEMLNIAKRTHNLLTIKDSFREEEFLDKMSKQSTTRKKRSIFPLPYLSRKNIDTSLRTTEEDWLKVSKIASRMIDSRNTVISAIGKSCSKQMSDIAQHNKTNNNFLFVCKLSEDEKRNDALEGPGRKKFLKVESQESDIWKSQHKSKNYSINPGVNVDDVEQESWSMSQRTTLKSSGFVDSDMEDLVNLSGPGLEYVKICQTIYREININAMRGDRRKRYIVKPTGVEGVYVCLYPGTKLRCGELANIVWFKIIIESEYEDQDDQFSDSWMFKRLTRDGQICFSKWLSCDVHRLDHYIRCHDKILMGYTSLITQRFKSLFSDDNVRASLNPIDASLNTLINKDDSNVLGLIIMTYMEDKRSTSKMLQNIRYLVMTSISIYPKFSQVMDKFAEAIRSPLQLYFLKRSLHFIKRMKVWKFGSEMRFGSVHYDYKSHMFLDSHGGSVIMLPRPLVSSSTNLADFSEILGEMYFTMLFNKNQDDPTHASFQILDKIIEGEDNFCEVKKMNMHLGYHPDLSDEDYARKIIDEPRNHQFSRRAIEIGSKLLRIKLDDPFGDQLSLSAQRSNINKTIDEFATFKSSAEFDNPSYNPMKTRQNPRRRCIEGVNELLSNGLMTSFDVAEEYRDKDTYFHIFKKNQIGGVREILILPINVRIRINILETLSRNICSFDRREVLTHGSTKNESIKAVLYTSKKYEGTRIPIHMTFDKSKWGPSFVPIQFLYLFTPFKNKLGKLFFFICDMLIRHQNKFCLMPDRLVKAWFLDKENKHKHLFPGLQRVKMEFLRTKNLQFKNESNMGQGILHYTSSLLHLCVITFRDKLYQMWCKELNLDSSDHEDLLSSDDSYTIFCPEVSKSSTELVKVKLNMFLSCQQVAEYLFNCRTSMVKSSINPLIGEFNSLFISNMTFIPTLIKYSLASVHPPNTDSFYRMVKESYGSSRQIVENGGGLDLYLLSSHLNKRYCEGIYHTYPGGVNNLKPQGISKVPYHLGHFPIFNPALMVCFGPEYYNYHMFKSEWNSLNSKEQQLFMASHKIIKGGVVETMAEFESGDTILGGVLRIEAKMGPVKQLNRIRDNALLSREEISSRLETNPLLIISKPRSIDEVIFRVTHKLYVTGANEALKNVASSIFYGRMSATVSAEIFYIPNHEPKDQTYLECLKQLMNESPIENLEAHIKFLYPKHVDYDIFINLQTRFEYRIRDPMEIQTVQTLITHKIYTKLTQNVPDLLAYLWGDKVIPEHLYTKVLRDYKLINIHFPMIKPTLEETMSQFSGEHRDKIKSVLLLILKLYSLKDKNFKGVIYGYGSGDIYRSYLSLMERNYTSSMSGESTSESTLSRIMRSYEKIYFAHNHTILTEFTEEKVSSNMWEDLSEEEISVFFQDTSVPKTIKKRVFMCAVANKFIKNAEEWSNHVGIILHSWHRKQHLNENGKYMGPCDLTLFMGSKRMNCRYNDKMDRYYLSKNNLNDPTLIKEFLSELSSVLDMTPESLSRKAVKGKWMIVEDKVLLTVGDGFDIREMEIPPTIDFNNCTMVIERDWTRLMSDGRRILNIETGLLACTFQPKEEYDFRVFGLKLSRICELRAFDQNFNVGFGSKKSSLDALDDLRVSRPMISGITKRRLPFTKDWSDKADDDLAGDVTIEDTTDRFMDSLINQDFSSDDYKELLKTGQSGDERLEEFVSYLLNTDVVYSMRTTQRIQHSRKIFLIISNLKYDLICHQINPGLRVNTHLIKVVKKLFDGLESQYIEYSLVSLYDRIHPTDGTKSPSSLKFDVDKRFIEKFGLEAEDEDE
jgi:hypothetical protein